MNISSFDGRIVGSPPGKVFLLSTCTLALLVGATCAPPKACAQAQPAVVSSTAIGTVSQDLRQLARKCIASGDYDTAISYLEALVSKGSSDTPDIKADLGLCYKFKRNYPKAMLLFSEVAKVAGPRQAEVLFWMDDSYCEQARFDAAVEHLTSMYNDHPDLREHVLTRRADRLEALGRLDESVADVRELIERYPGNGQINRYKVRLAGLLLRATGANAEFDAAYQDASASATAERDAQLRSSLRHDLGCICLAKEDILWAQTKRAEAMQLLDKILVECPDLKADVLLRRALRKQILSQYAEATNDLRAFVSAYPEDERVKVSLLSIVELTLKGSGNGVDAQNALREVVEMLRSKSLSLEQSRSLTNELGLVFIRTGLFDDAEKLFQQLLDEDAFDNHVKLNLGLVYRGKKDYDRALPLIKDVVERSTGETQLEAVVRYAECLMDQYKFQEAVDYMAQQCGAHPEFELTLLTRRARCLRDNLFKCDEAKAVFQQIVASHPETPEAQAAEISIADIALYAEKRANEARELLQLFLAKNPNYKDMLSVCDSLAACCYTEKNYAQAAALYEQGLTFYETGTWHPFFLYMLGDCYERIGDKAKAKENWNKLMQQHPKDPWVPFAEKGIQRMGSGGKEE